MLRPLRAFGAPLLDLVAPTPYVDHVHGLVAALVVFHLVARSAARLMRVGSSGSAVVVAVDTLCSDESERASRIPQEGPWRREACGGSSAARELSTPTG